MSCDLERAWLVQTNRSQSEMPDTNDDFYIGPCRAGTLNLHDNIGRFVNRGLRTRGKSAPLATDGRDRATLFLAYGAFMGLSRSLSAGCSPPQTFVSVAGRCFPRRVAYLSNGERGSALGNSSVSQPAANTAPVSASTAITVDDRQVIPAIVANTMRRTSRTSPRKANFSTMTHTAYASPRSSPRH